MADLELMSTVFLPLSHFVPQKRNQNSFKKNYIRIKKIELLILLRYLVVIQYDKIVFYCHMKQNMSQSFLWLVDYFLFHV